MQPFLVACRRQNNLKKILEIQPEDLIGDAASSESCLLVEEAGVEDSPAILIARSEVKVTFAVKYFMYEMMHKIGQNPVFSSTF